MKRFSILSSWIVIVAIITADTIGVYHAFKRHNTAMGICAVFVPPVAVYYAIEMFSDAPKPIGDIEISREHFEKSIAYYNKALYVVGDNNRTCDNMNKFIDYEKMALSEGLLVDIGVVNDVYPGLGDHFKDEYMSAINMLIQHFHSNESEAERMATMDQIKSLFIAWEKYYNETKDKINEHYSTKGNTNPNTGTKGAKRAKK